MRLFSFIRILLFFFTANLTAGQTLLDSVIATTINTQTCTTPDTRYSCWASQMQKSYNAVESQDSRCLDHIFEVCKNPFKLLQSRMQHDTVSSLCAYYQRSIQSWKSVDTPTNDQFTLFINHMYCLDKCIRSCEVSATNKFTQIMNVYGCMLRKWQIELEDRFLLAEGYDLNNYLVPGYRNLEEYCYTIVAKAREIPNVSIVRSNINIVPDIILEQKTIDPWEKELCYWYGSQLLSVSSDKHLLNFIINILNKIKQVKAEETSDEAFRSELNEILEYLLQVASIVETSIIFKEEKSIDYLRPSDSIRDKSISSDTLRYFEKTLDNFYLQCFLRGDYLKDRCSATITDTANTKFGAIKSFYAIKLNLKGSIIELKKLLEAAIKGKTVLVEQVSNDTYKLTLTGQKIDEQIRRVGCCTNQNYLDQQDLNEIETIKNHPIVVLIANNRHLLSRIQCDGILFFEKYYDLKHAALEYISNQKTFIQFYTPPAQPKESRIVPVSQSIESEKIEKAIPGDSSKVFKQDNSQFFSKKLLFAGITIASLLGFLYYAHKNPESYLHENIEHLLNHMRSLLVSR